MKSSRTNTTYTIARSVRESVPVPGVRVITSAMPGNPVVSIVGSLYGGTSCAENPMIPEVLASLFAEGTKKRSKQKIEETLDAIGADVSFDVTEERIVFSARCLKKDVATVLGVIAEELTVPLLSSAAFEKIKKRLEGALHQAEDSTRTRAMDRFLHTLYPAGHPHHMPEYQERLSLLKKITLTEVVAYHAQVVVRGSCIVSAAGAVTHAAIAREVKKGFSKLPLGTQSPRTPEFVDAVSRAPVSILVEGKPNMDVFIGAPLRLTKNDKEYFALAAALGILGGREGFNGRLMQIVREKMGLTYGIYTFLSGFDEGRAGYWYVWATFSPSDLEKGVSATKKEIVRLVEKGVTDAELMVRKNITRGSYAIALSTTGARAIALLKNAEDGRSPSFIDQYPEIIDRLTKKEITAVVKKYLDPKTLFTVSAGGK